MLSPSGVTTYNLKTKQEMKMKLHQSFHLRLGGFYVSLLKEGTQKKGIMK